MALHARSGKDRAPHHVALWRALGDAEKKVLPGGPSSLVVATKRRVRAWCVGVWHVRVDWVESSRLGSGLVTTVLDPIV